MSTSLSYRICLAAAVLLCPIFTPSARAADGDFGLSLVFAYGPYYVHNRWLPVRAMVTNRSDRDVRGHVVIPIKGEQGTVTFRMPVTVPSKTNCQFTGYIYIPVQPPPPPPRRGQPTVEPPVAVSYLEDSSGAQLHRSEMLGRLIRESDRPDKATGTILIDRPLVLAVTDDLAAAESATDSVVNNSSSFAEMFQSGPGLPVYAQPLTTSDLPRQLSGYDLVSIVILSGVSPQALDAAQRQALMDFMTAGGTVLLAAPRGSADPTGTWLAPYLPAAWVGERFATAWTMGGATTRPALPLDVAEFVAHGTPPPGARVVAADDHYVHLAYTPVGYGRLAVSSFPVSALDTGNPAVQALWRQTVVPAAGVLDWDRSRMGSAQNEILQSMVGLKAPPWGLAAGIVGAYVLVVLLIQLGARQTLRPTGFATTIGAALLLAGALLVISLFKDQTVELSMARVSITDLETGGVRHEAVALLGTQDAIITAVPGASVRDEVGGSDQVTLVTSPAGAITTLQPRQIGHIWQASAAVGPEQALRVRGQFDAEGLKLNIDNTAGTIVSPLLLADGRHFSLPDLPVGQSTVAATEQNLNPPGLPITSKAVQGEREQLRGRIMDAAMKPSLDNPPMTAPEGVESSLLLAGWFEEAPAPLVALRDGQLPRVAQANAMVRTRVALQPSPVGSRVKVHGAFTRILNGQGMTIPYDINKREWIPQFNAGQEFQIGFAVPPAVGRLRPTRVTLQAHFNAPQHTVTVRRGQCASGKVELDATGPEVAKWDRPIGPQTVSFDVSPGDYDVNGWVWLAFYVDSDVLGTAKWDILEMSLGYEAEVTGEPSAPVLPQRQFGMPDRDPPREPAKQPAKKPAQQPKANQSKANQTKKPATTKPATPKKDAPKK